MRNPRNGPFAKSDPLDEESHPLAHFRTPLDENFENPSFDVTMLRNRLRLTQTEFARRFGFPIAASPT